MTLTWNWTNDFSLIEELKMNTMFRPLNRSTRLIVKQRLKFGHAPNYNFCSRVRWYPAGWKLNQRVIGSIHGRLHYLACHAPVPVQKRWTKTYENFYKKHFGTHKASARYLNQWSCHAWM